MSEVAMDTLLIVNAAIVNEGRIHTGDVYISAGRIEAIGADLAARPADLVLDAAGLTLMPGMIDDQVHFRQPGLTHKGDIATESRAAVAGGITSYMEMPNTLPATTDRLLLEEKFAAARRRSFANYSFYLGGANDNLEEIKALDPNAACGIKVFMGSSTGSLLVDDPRALEDIFTHAPTLVATHCEDDGVIAQNTVRFKKTHGEDIPVSAHPLIRSAEACYRSSALAVELARAHGTRLHILHLSTARELSLLTRNPLVQKQITAEVCVHHLYFDDADYAAKGTLIKCNPAIKTAADRQALIEAVGDGRIDVIATDHAPHTLKEKRQPYVKAPSGLPLVQQALVCLLEHYHDGRFSLPLIAEKTAHNPARRFEVRDRGFIREGAWADLVLVDLNRPHVADEEDLFYRCGWSPFSGRTFRSTIDCTIVSGVVVYRNGKVNPKPAGLRLEFDRPT